MYGDKVPELLEIIKKSKKMFESEPIGPIGMLIKVKDEKWATAIETNITSSNLKTFLIRSHKDAQLFLKLASQIGW